MALVHYWGRGVSCICVFGLRYIDSIETYLEQSVDFRIYALVIGQLRTITRQRGGSYFTSAFGYLDTAML